MSYEETIEHAQAIADEYAEDGLTLTLRQLYYRMVATGLCGNGQKIYKNIGAQLTKARYNGDFCPSLIEDRGRSVEKGSFVEDSATLEDGIAGALTALYNSPRWYIERDRWIGQDYHCSVWVEKEALSGVFAPTCKDLGVSFQACKGYPSISQLWEWMALVAKSQEVNGHHTAVILYAGDHDPDGLQIPKTIANQLSILGAQENAPECFRHRTLDIEVAPFALTMEQIEEHNPPPFPAKPTSSRFAKYLEATGTTDAWELDALEPLTLRDLIRTNVDDYFDPLTHDNNQAIIRAAREEMREDPRFIEAMEALRR